MIKTTFNGHRDLIGPILRIILKYQVKKKNVKIQFVFFLFKSPDTSHKHKRTEISNMSILRSLYTTHIENYYYLERKKKLIRPKAKISIKFIR